ncbi:hypothetical protein ACS0TY_028587 [Phlomoides rotata]
MHSFAGVTFTTQMHRSVLADGQILNVIDTPGLFDSSIEPKSIGNEIAKCINMAKNGIHAVLVVVSLRSRFSLEEESAIDSLRQFFGGKIGDYMILVFTHGDVLRKMSIDEYLSRNCPEPLEKTIRLCGGRYVLFDNETEDEMKKSRQLEELLRLVDTVVENNDGVPYTNELFVDSPDVQMNGFLEKVFLTLFTSNLAFVTLIESKLRETAVMLEKQLAEERIARMKAEADTREAQMKLCNGMSQVMLDLERSQRDADELRKIQTETEKKFKEAEAKIKENEEKLMRNENELNEAKRYLDTKFGCVIS